MLLPVGLDATDGYLSTGCYACCNFNANSIRDMSGEPRHGKHVWTNFNTIAASGRYLARNGVHVFVCLLLMQVCDMGKLGVKCNSCETKEEM